MTESYEVQRPVGPAGLVRDREGLPRRQPPRGAAGRDADHARAAPHGRRGAGHATAPTDDRASAFAHDAVLDLDPDGDDRAPAGRSPSRSAAAGRTSRRARSRRTTPASTGPATRSPCACSSPPSRTDEARVRALVDEVLARGEGEDPDGVRTSWRLLGVRPLPRPAEERDHAERLPGS